jgi:hypothetical protein
MSLAKTDLPIDSRISTTLSHYLNHIVPPPPPAVELQNRRDSDRTSPVRAAHACRYTSVATQPILLRALGFFAAGAATHPVRHDCVRVRSKQQCVLLPCSMLILP